MSIDISNTYADYTVHGGNQEESQYEIPGDPESAKTAEKKSRFNNRTAKCVGVLSLITMLNVAMFIALMAMHFQVQSSWRHELIKTQDSIEQLNVSAANSENALLSLRAGQRSIQGSIEANINSVTDSVNKLQKLTGWHKFGNFAYKHFAEAVTFDTAGKRCQSYGGRLAAAILRDPDAVRHMLNQKRVGTHADGSGQWIGFNDIQREGSWKWIDGGEMNPETTGWNTGEPNNDGKGTSEDCGQIAATLSTKILLNDASCSGPTKFPYICEVEIM